MPNETNPMLALKNAWNGAIAASDRLKELAPALQALPDDSDVKAIDLEAYRDAALAQSIAALALRGLIEDLQPRPVVQAQD